MSPAKAVDAISAMHLLRPGWLWALVAIPLLLWLWRQRQRRASVWREAVDPHLLPHLLDATPAGSGRWALPLGVLGYALAVVALAGPSWRQVEQPLWQSQTPLVIALDLSSATLAPDLPPSRLAQARAKLAALLRERSGGQVGLFGEMLDGGEDLIVVPEWPEQEKLLQEKSALGYFFSGHPFTSYLAEVSGFAKRQLDSLEPARRGYKEINLRALKLLAPGGFLITCTCSYHVRDDLFRAIVAEAAIDAHATVSLVESRTQARDHPILLNVPETQYLKCLILRKLA